MINISHNNKCKAETEGRCSFDCLKCCYEKLQLISRDGATMVFNDLFIESIKEIIEKK